MAKKVLIVDDDKNIVKLLLMYLSESGYEVFSANDGSEAMDRFHQVNPDLVLLDVMMPIINGWEVLNLIRNESTTPVITLTSRDMIEDKIKGFKLGADDYIIKPFEPQEVLVRVEARMNHGKVEIVKTEKERGVVAIGNLRIDLNRYEVMKDANVIALKPKEVQLLYFLMQNHNIVFSRDQLLEKVWDYDFLIDTRTVDVHIKRLRQMLEPSNSNWSIKTVWGVGYKFEKKDR